MNISSFEVTNADKVLSPDTGMSRSHWLAAGEHILKGAFQYVKDFYDPMFLPKQPGKTYPVEGNENASQQHRSAAIFEAIARTFNVAFPLLHNNPDLTINGIHLGDYYRYHILNLLTDESCYYYIGKEKDYALGVQQTCELGNLAMWSILIPDVFWDRLNKDEQDAIAQTLTEWGEGKTYPHNWRWFNTMMLTFLDLKGYPCDRDILIAHVDHLLLHYAGDGWYRDISYDYYTIHVFHLYGRVWSKYYGVQHHPERAQIITENFNAFMENYQMIFSKAGHISMYGRSILYRLGASAGMSAAFMGKPDDLIAPGAARRIASTTLLQFIGHPDFFHNGIPALGFYGPFEEAIQPYSCSASPYWMFLNFSVLTLPADHAFWNETETNDYWDTLADKQNSHFLQGPGMLVTNHGTTGTSELRPGKISNDNPNYCRLVYNTTFLWEGNTQGGSCSSSLTLKTEQVDERAFLPDSVDIAGYRDHVFYRQASFRGLFAPHVDMATIIIPHGEIRIDRLRKTQATTLYLGHFALPHKDGKQPTITQRTVDAKPVLIMSAPNQQTAFTNYLGWDSMDVRHNSNIHPETEKSSHSFACTTDTRQYGPVDMLISVLLHKTDNAPWSDDELNPIKEVTNLVPNTPMHLKGIKVSLKNGDVYEVDFRSIDGACSRH